MLRVFLFSDEKIGMKWCQNLEISSPDNLKDIEIRRNAIIGFCDAFKSSHQEDIDLHTVMQAEIIQNAFWLGFRTNARFLVIDDKSPMYSVLLQTMKFANDLLHKTNLEGAYDVVLSVFKQHALNYNATIFNMYGMQIL